MTKMRRGAWQGLSNPKHNPQENTYVLRKPGSGVSKTQQSEEVSKQGVVLHRVLEFKRSVGTICSGGGRGGRRLVVPRD